MARPSEYDIELCKQICELIADGGSVRSVLAQNEDYPDFTTWCRWKRNNEELQTLYVNAQQDKQKLIEETYQQLVEDYTKRLEVTNGNIYNICKRN